VDFASAVVPERPQGRNDPLGTSLILPIRAHRDASASIGIPTAAPEPAPTGKPGNGLRGCQQFRPYKQEVTGPVPVPPHWRIAWWCAGSGRRAHRLQRDGRGGRSWKPLPARTASVAAVLAAQPHGCAAEPSASGGQTACQRRRDGRDACDPSPLAWLPSVQRPA
jgi:hypothetical protein